MTGGGTIHLPFFFFFFEGGGGWGMGFTRFAMNGG